MMDHQTEPSSSSSSSSPPSLQDLLMLLRGKTDSQRLAGLLLVTQYCDKNDQHTLLTVYHAIGSTFLHRLLLTGMGKHTAGLHNPNREAYLRLSITLLAAFARLSHIAATDDMLAKVPLFWRLPPRSSHSMELAMKLVQLVISKLPAGKVYVDHPSELSKMVAAIAKQFALLHNSLKFEALHLLSTVLSSNNSGALHAALQSMSGDWSTSMRVGIMDVLQNRVAPAEKLQALLLAECVISIVGEEWLIGPTTLHGAHSSFPADRCILLVLESSRVEIAVILNELAYLKYEVSKNCPPNAETFLAKLRNLGVCIHWWKELSNSSQNLVKMKLTWQLFAESNATSIISESTFTKIIGGLNETIDVVLDYLQDAKDHGERKGDDLLASVRIVGSYLAEAPCACKEKVEGLLDYMLSVEGGDESSPFYSISFLLPVMCQITMKDDGCKLFASAGGFRADILPGQTASPISKKWLRYKAFSPILSKEVACAPCAAMLTTY
ncbi:UNVERIFIED_CONTAM: Neurochondrin [Sesamum angustifolium]|uniref:Neurochondrin n=1 Tax=Sesamum angustifolium TaxID=2727405 RepID=A0AAW2JA15_9LAMI